MKKTLFTLIALSFVLLVKAQSGSTKNIIVDDIKTGTDSSIFTSVEHVPEYPGGLSEFGRFLGKNIIYPKISVDDHIEGRVILSFVIEQDGSLTNVKVVREVSPEIDAEALRVMKLSPKWKPGTQNGRPVRVLYSVPINFSLSRK